MPQAVDYAALAKQAGAVSSSGPMTMTPSDSAPNGLVTPGNIDLAHRPHVKNPDGSISTVLSMSFGTDKGEVLVPKVSPDGRILTDQQAIDLYNRTGQHLGIFKTPDAADRYAETLHQDQAKSLGSVDYAALAKQAGATTEQMPPIGSEVSAPNFKTTNATDAQGQPEVDPNTLGTFVKHLWAGVNPVQIGQMLPFPKALGGSGTDNPLSPTNIAQSLHQVKKEADTALAKGDYVGALAKYVESVVPILGPMMAHQGNELQQGSMRLGLAIWPRSRRPLPPRRCSKPPHRRSSVR